MVKPKQYRAQAAYDAAINSPTRKVRWVGADAKEARRLYQILLEWRDRHPEKHFRVMLDGEAVYIEAYDA